MSEFSHTPYKVLSSRQFSMVSVLFYWLLIHSPYYDCCLHSLHFSSVIETYIYNQLAIWQENIYLSVLLLFDCGVKLLWATNKSSLWIVKSMIHRNCCVDILFNLIWSIQAGILHELSLCVQLTMLELISMSPKYVKVRMVVLCVTILSSMVCSTLFCSDWWNILLTLWQRYYHRDAALHDTELASPWLHWLLQCCSHQCCNFIKVSLYNTKT